MGQHWFTSVTFPLFVLYLIITLVVAFQIGRIIYNKFGFLLLGFLWGIIRTVFWLTFFQITNPLIADLLLNIPINIQFATYSLLVLFYAHVVHRQTWEKSTKKIFTITYCSVNLILLILQCVSILAFYGWRLHFIISSTKSAQLQSQLPISIIPITFIIFLSFTSRCIFDFVSALGSIPGINLDCGSLKQSVTIIISYFVWEILPYILILVLFWRIPSTQIGGLKRNKNNLTYPQTPAPGRVINQGQQPGALARLFLDPQRYDSDDETTTLLYKNSPANLYNGRNSPYSTTPIDEHHDSEQGSY
ncbi:hypothetical protein PPL_01878 [Heterostelium album PN500]|uniref:THH1/TOM1/TOM3 domain-containing protein n=1 Tax=Heterostelium pallidum (strain ATCC 26659 / Pp 5 / PN500) TaxID=670386 RepID=D3B0R1_HETP5|nr:hypothetical protein PPL_01878 [Heterostelium album PN500]EFA84885.1 hypothetical protein PPL_01878 [Heterostelium album PN500]|eukprot:XP_020436996.1 hypothetical protein PPL_01878 [Heterostelium album PN500]